MDKSVLRQLIMLTKYTVYVFLAQLCFTMVIFAHTGNAQKKGLDDIDVTVQAQNEELKSVFRRLEKQSHFRFSYNTSVLKVKDIKVTLDETNVPLSNVLASISNQAQLKFVQINENIHVSKSSETLAVEANIEDFAEISGIVLDGRDGFPIPGVAVLVKGTSRGSVTDMDGRYTVEATPSDVLVFSFVGYQSQEILVGDQTTIDVTLEESQESLEEVVIIGYAEQRKESVIGAVIQTDSEVLQRTGGVSNLGAALTGNLPGLVTTSSTGMPGDENPQILIRGQSSWNGSSPLILVDGVERPEFFNQMDIGSVESISVLKDASATAVFGSRGANGVIIVTTKRGRDGRAEITATVNSTVKTASQLPGKMDSYDALMVRNRAIEYELSRSPDSWNQFLPQAIIDKYRFPADLKESERYPNVDWQDILFRDYAMAYNANVAIRGGTEFTKYFASVDFQNEGDLFQSYENNRGYSAGYDFNRLNFRSNLDFQLTPTTQLKVNLGGTYGMRKSPWGGGNSTAFWGAAYNNPPDAFMPIYSDGFWGYFNPDPPGATNSVSALAVSGVEFTTTANLTTNFVLEQDLGMLVDGLNFRGTLAVDNQFVEVERGINDQFNSAQQKWIDPNTGQEFFAEPFDANTRFDFREGIAWSPSIGTVEGAQRRIFYQTQLNYVKTIKDDHNVTMMGLLSRQEDAIGSMIPMYREDWVFRATYDYRKKYLFEYNGAYNGSEKFAPDYRFAFFSSGGIGWLLSEENFMKSISEIDYLKIRASYGEVGDDMIGGRFLFMNQWAYGDNSQLSTVGWQGDYSPYTWFVEEQVGNPNVRWETVYKYNLGAEFSFWDGLIEGSVDVFRDNRVDILMTGDRAIPSYFGTDAPAANLGRVQTDGFEIVVGANHTFQNGLRIWGDFAMTHAKDLILDRDDPELLSNFQQQRNYQIGQARTHISHSYYNTWDELYASTEHNTNNMNKIPGNFHILDMNGDGVIDDYDVAPYAFSGTPQNTFNTNVGFEYRGLSLFLQFYGVNNVSRQVVFNSLAAQRNLVFEEGSYWSIDNQNPDSPMPRWLALASPYNSGSRYFFDGSYLRLKNAEIAYRLQSTLVERIGVQSMRVFVNGNNLLLWTDMPDDRESNFAGTGWASQGAYPTVRRFNLGLNVTF